MSTPELRQGSEPILKFVSGNESGTFEISRYPERKGIPSVSFVSGESTKLIDVIGQSSVNRLLGTHMTLSKLF